MQILNEVHNTCITKDKCMHEGRKEPLHFPDTLSVNEIKNLKQILSNLDKETFYKEAKVPDYGTLDEKTTLIEVMQRLASEDVVEIQ